MLDENLKQTLERLRALTEPLIELERRIFSAPIIDLKRQFDSIYGQVMQSYNELKNNPEFNFLSIIDKEEIDINEIELQISTVESNIEIVLNKIGIYELWEGANFALTTDVKQNPDRVRHFFISLRTIIEYLLITLLAPDKKVKEWDKLIEHIENSDDKEQKITRRIRIKYVSSKIKFGILDEFTEKEIKFINELYKEVCKVHSPSIAYSEEELKYIKLKAGTTIWLLSELYILISENE